MDTSAINSRFLLKQLESEEAYHYNNYRRLIILHLSLTNASQPHNYDDCSASFEQSKHICDRHEAYSRTPKTQLTRIHLPIRLVIDQVDW